jgi:hypothetical protein
MSVMVTTTENQLAKGESFERQHRAAAEGGT